MCWREKSAWAHPDRHKQSGAETITTTSAVQSSEERRNATRYKMGAPAEFTWKGAANKYSESIGTVLDMSVEGIFISTTDCPQVGTEVNIEVVQPNDRGRSKYLIKARMKVLRIDHDANQGCGLRFAAQGKVFIGRTHSHEEAAVNGAKPVIFKKIGSRRDSRMNSVKSQDTHMVQVTPISKPFDPHGQ